MLFYAAPALPLAFLGLPLAVQLPAFWAETMGLDLSVIGLVLTVTRLLDVLFDPLTGRISDHLRTRWGRRRPIIATALPVALLGLFGLFFPPHGAGAWWLAACNALMTLGWTLLSLPYWAWGAELSTDYAERARITSLREAATILGIVVSALVPAIIASANPGAGLHVLSWLTLGLGTPLVALLLWRVPEPAVPVTETRPASLGAALRMAAANAPFRRLLLAWLVNGVANGLPAVLFILLCQHLLHAPAAYGPLLLAYFAAGLVCVPLWLWVAGHIGKHRAWAVAMLWSCLCFAFVLALGPGDVPAFLAISLGSGAGLGADLALPPAMQADVIDLDELQSGERRAGLFFAAWTMAQKAGNALAAGIAFPVLGLVGFHSAGSNGRAQIWVLVGLYCLLPILLKLVATILVWQFPIDRNEQARIRAAIAARPARARAGA